MKKNQTLIVNGYEVILFPMEYMNITQGENGSFSHQGTNAIDCAGKDTGIDPLFAPVTMKCVAKDSATNGNAVAFESVNKVMFADGTIDYACFLFIHDNYIGDYNVGSIFKQGQEFGDEGTAGRATGNHSHIEVAKGRYTGRMYKQNSYGVWQLPNTCHTYDAFVIDGTNVINKAGYNYKESKNMGSSKNGWEWSTELKEQTYYKNGVMQTNLWVEDPVGSNTWYWLKYDGRMARNELLEINGSLRIFMPSGILATYDNLLVYEDNTLALKR